MADKDHSTVRTDPTVFAGNRQWLRTGYDLIWTTPDGGERRIPVCYSHMTIGSSFGRKTNDLTINEKGVANRQVLLKLIQGNVYLNNISPKFGIQVNGETVTFRQLKPNDQINVAGHRVQLIRLQEKVAFLEGYTSPHLREHWTLASRRTTLGREGRRRNDVALDDPTVSREHASIEFSDGVFVLTRETDNITQVNAEPVKTLRVLNDEDLIQLGQQLLRFRTYKATDKPRALLPRDATILFSDIWDYTRLAESRPLEETIGQLNDVYKSLGGVIVEKHGILMTYLGDAMMAVFGAQADNPDKAHAQHAVEAALEMLRALRSLNEDWGSKGQPQLRIGVGIASGEVMVGDVGVTGHREFAAMGDTTNVASRIEKLTRDYDAHILISGATESCLDDSIARRNLGSVEVRGRRGAVELYQVLPENLL